MNRSTLYRLAAVIAAALLLATLIPLLMQSVFHIRLSPTLTLNWVLVILISLGLPCLRQKIALRHWNSRHHPKIDKHTPNPNRVTQLPTMNLPKWQIFSYRSVMAVAMAALLMGFGSFKSAFMLSTFIWAADNPLLVVFLLAFAGYLLLCLPLFVLLKWSAHRHGKTSTTYQHQENWGLSLVDAIGLSLVLCLLARVLADGLGML